MPKKKTPVATAGQNGGRSLVVAGAINRADHSEALQDLQRRIHALPSPREQFSGAVSLHVLSDTPDRGLYTLYVSSPDGGSGGNDDWAVCVSGLEILLRLEQWKADCADIVTNWDDLAREMPKALRHIPIMGGAL